MKNKLTIFNVCPEDTAEAEVFEFSGLSELTQIPLVNWAMKDDRQSQPALDLKFYRLALDGLKLYAEYNMGTRYCYLGELEHKRDIHLRDFNQSKERVR